MAQLVEGSAAGVAVLPDGLLATKLHVPAPRPDFVTRPRLVAQLDDSVARTLILVCAPAGFGKTALLADWGHRSRRSLAWLSLDAGDNDPVRFWRHIVAALERFSPGIARRIGPMLGPPAPSSFDGMVGALINELVSQPAEAEIVLALDDYHVIDSPAVHGSVAFLLEHLPPRVRLVLSARADPPLPLARLRAAGELVELRVSDLRFTTEEAASLLREVLGPDRPLTNASLAALEARTEGWAAGLQLAALSLRGQTDVDGFIADFGGSHRYVLDYLTEEVLECQAPERRSFLLETSILERVSGELCDALTGRADGQAMLEEIERANLFLVPLDEVRGWWRYHHLFADLLQVRLNHEKPEQVQGLHLRAAAWYEEHGLAEEAARHSIAADDMRRAAQLIERHADGLIVHGQVATLERLIAALPAEMVATRPRLLVARGVLAHLAGDQSSTERLLDAAERALADDADEPFQTSAGGTVSWMANVPATIALGRAAVAHNRGDAEGALAFSHQLLAELAEGEYMLEALGRLELGRAEWLAGRLAGAERTLGVLVERLEAAQPTAAAWAAHELGHVQSAQGRLDAAAATYQRTIGVAARSDGVGLHATVIGHFGLAEVAYQRDALDEALRHVNEAIPLSRQVGDHRVQSWGLAMLGLIRQAQGDPSGALEAMTEAVDVAPGPEAADLFNPVPAQHARLLLVQGDARAAADWVAGRHLAAVGDPAYAWEPAYLTLARVLRAQGRAAEAVRLLERLHARATTEDRNGSVIEIQALRALASADRADEAGALSFLSDALTLAYPQGYVRIFADEGPAMGALLGRFLANQRSARTEGDVPAQYVARLVAAIEPERPPGPSPDRRASVHVPGLVEALSERELEVLQLLAAGKANREIADELYVTLHTVKKHITHILGKLGAANRTEAAARARELGLLG